MEQNPKMIYQIASYMSLKAYADMMRQHLEDMFSRMDAKTKTIVCELLEKEKNDNQLS